MKKKSEKNDAIPNKTIDSQNAKKKKKNEKP